MSITRPLLAAKREKAQTEEEFFDGITFPVMCSAKLDGIRCLKINGEIVSRSFKPIPNEHVRRMLRRLLPDGIDGELMVRGNADFNQIQSAIMTIKGAPQFEYWAFDYVKASLDKPYRERIEDLKAWFSEQYPKNKMMPMDALHDVKLVLPVEVRSSEELIEYERKTVGEGFEGVMIRHPLGPYKCGRATYREGTLTKVVRKFRDEGIVVGFEERMHNENEQEQDEFGLSKRSTKKEGKTRSGTLGRLTLRMPSGLEFGVGTGFNDELRQLIWDNKKDYLGKTVTYEYRELSKDNIPRFPVWIGTRNLDDMS
ncbi:MAG: ATP-dependent DNA ligase [Gammaproteobacteria bacterium]|nr:MAG: ATP-dependent DNA ligase [Gammaproteobacteria bacterium]RKZ95504.1 MAG: ATP-dependent DNA ligase [Gammaproteobacteria bacterium]